MKIKDCVIGAKPTEYLQVISLPWSDIVYKTKKKVVKVRCVCGNELTVRVSKIATETFSCGCAVRIGTALGEDGYKRCAMCHEYKYKTEFIKDSYSTDKLCSYCKQCSRLIKIKNKYGLCPVEYFMMLDYQRYKCALCHRALNDDIVVDHDHQTGKVRGLLHNDCNAMLGFAGDTVYRLEQGVGYLRKHSLTGYESYDTVILLNDTSNPT